MHRGLCWSETSDMPSERRSGASSDGFLERQACHKTAKSLEVQFTWHTVLRDVALKKKNKKNKNVAPFKKSVSVGGRMGLGYITNKALIQREHSMCLLGIHLTGGLTAASYLQPDWSAILLTMLSWKHYRKCVCLGSALLYQSQTAGTKALSTMPGFQQ